MENDISMKELNELYNNRLAYNAQSQYIEIEIQYDRLRRATAKALNDNQPMNTIEDLMHKTLHQREILIDTYEKSIRRLTTIEQTDNVKHLIESATKGLQEIQQDY